MGTARAGRGQHVLLDRERMGITLSAAGRGDRIQTDEHDAKRDKVARRSGVSRIGIQDLLAGYPW